MVLTNWEEYKELEQIDLTNKILIDPRRIFNKEKINAKEYFSIGLRWEIFNISF